MNVDLKWTELGFQLAKGNFRALRKYVKEFYCL